MPGRQDVAPVGLEEDPLLQFGQGGAFEQGEISGVELLVGLEVDGLAEMDFLGIDLREHSIVAAGRKVEVDRPQLLVSRALVDERSGEVDDRVDMLAGSGAAERALDSKGLQVVQEAVQLLLRIDGMVETGRSRFLDGTAVQIGDQDHGIDGEVFQVQKASQQVSQQKTA